MQKELQGESLDRFTRWALYLILASVTFGGKLLKTHTPQKQEKFVLDSYFKMEDSVQAPVEDFQ